MATGTQPGTPQYDTSSPGAGQQAKQQAQDLLGDVKDTARAKMGEQQKAAATGVGDFARALREAAKNSGDGSSLAARTAQGAAERLERLSGTLRSKDLDSVVREAESFARREPMLFLGATVAAGFLAIRLLKSAAPQTDEIKRRL